MTDGQTEGRTNRRTDGRWLYSAL